MIMKTFCVVMRRYKYLVIRKIFSQPHPDFVSGLCSKLVIGSEGLDDMIVTSPVILSVLTFNKSEFLECGLGRTIQTVNQFSLGCFVAGDIIKYIIHRTTRCNKLYNTIDSELDLAA